MSIIKTERLVLRPFRKDDARAMYRNWTSDARVAEYCRWYAHEDISVTEALLAMYIDEAAEGFDYRWAITLKENDEPIGCVDVVGVDNVNVPDIGYVLSRKYWGKGIMTEAVKAVFDELFRCGFNKIGAWHRIENPASGRVMEKCGMEYKCVRMEQRKFGSDELCEVKYYEISR